MNPQSSRTLLWLSAALLLVGAAMSPAPAVLLMALAGLSALPPLLAGPASVRPWAVLLLVLSVTIGIAYFPDAERHQDVYQERAGGAQKR